MSEPQYPRFLGLIGLVLTIAFFACKEEKADKAEENEQTNATSTVSETTDVQIITIEEDNGAEETSVFGNPEAFVPIYEKILEKIRGDLNGDGKEDVVLFTESEEIFSSESGLDMNRGFYVIFKDGSGYKLAANMRQCFACANCFGMGYDISIEIKNGKLYIRTVVLGNSGGSDSFTFRYQNKAFELIGYDRYSRSYSDGTFGKSFNFLTKKMKETWEESLYSEKPESELESTEKWYNFKIKKPLKLTDITNLSTFDYNEYITLGEAL